MSRNEAATLLGRTMGLVAATAGWFALGAYLGRNLSHGWWWLFFIGSLLLLVGVNVTVNRSEQLAIALLFGFGAVTGLAVAPTLAYYTSADPAAVWQASGATALFVAGFGSAGYATRRDLTALARVLVWALLGLIVFGIVAIFVQIPNASLIYSVVGLIIFAGLIAFDFQRLRRSKDIRSAPVLAASIFLDILNVFLFSSPALAGARSSHGRAGGTRRGGAGIERQLGHRARAADREWWGPERTERDRPVADQDHLRSCCGRHEMLEVRQPAAAVRCG